MTYQPKTTAEQRKELVQYLCDVNHRGAKVQRIVDDLAACEAALAERQEILRSYLMELAKAEARIAALEQRHLVEPFGHTVHLLTIENILSTIDPSPDEPITAEWLREEWGFEHQYSTETTTKMSVEITERYWIDIYHRHGRTENYIEVIGETEFAKCNNKIRNPTRQQFSDLAKVLNIQRRTKHATEPKGCTCLNSPNMLYAPCSYCDKQGKDGAK